MSLQCNFVDLGDIPRIYRVVFGNLLFLKLCGHVNFGRSELGACVMERVDRDIYMHIHIRLKNGVVDEGAMFCRVGLFF